MQQAMKATKTIHINYYVTVLFLSHAAPRIVQDGLDPIDARRSAMPDTTGDVDSSIPNGHSDAHYLGT